MRSDLHSVRRLAWGRGATILLLLGFWTLGWRMSTAWAALPEETPEPTPIASTSTLARAITRPPRLNARQGPGTEYPAVTVLPQGTQVQVLAETEGEDGTWIQAQVDGLDEPVWLAGWLLDFVSDPADPEDSVSARRIQAAPTPLVVDISAGPVAVTQPARMNVRGGPGTEYPVVGTAPAGTQARILALGPSGQWFKVELPDREDPAWIYGPLTRVYGALDQVDQLSEAEIPPRPTPAPRPASVSVSPASAPAAAPVGSLVGYGFAYGIQAHMIHTGQEGRIMDLVRELGFTWVKQQVEWRIFESNPGQPDFRDLWPIINEAGARGINVLFSVVNAPDWAREPGFDASVGGPPADPQTYAAFVGALAREFCGTSLKAIEIWNEQNLHYEWGNLPLNPADYIRLLKPASRSIKANCPSIAVISGALTQAGDNLPWARDDFAYMEGMLQNGLANYVDGVGAHPSGYNVPPDVRWEDACAAIQRTGNRFNGPCDNPHHSWSFRSTMEGYRNLLVRYGAGHLRIWPTEFGWAAGGAFHPAYAYADDNDFDEQARWTVQAFQMMRDWGWVGPAFLWNLNFRVVANGTEKAQWGIIDPNWHPLPVFNALRDMPK